MRKAEGSDGGRDAEEARHVGDDDTTSSADHADGAGDSAMDLLAAALGLTPPAETVSTLATSPLEMAAVAAAAAAAASAASTKDDPDGAATVSNAGHGSTSGGGTNKTDVSSGSPLCPAPTSTETVAHTGVLSDSAADVYLPSVSDPEQQHGQDTDSTVATSA